MAGIDASKLLYAALGIGVVAKDAVNNITKKVKDSTAETRDSVKVSNKKTVDQKICPVCGAVLESHCKTCPVCGVALDTSGPEDDDETGNASETVVCPICGAKWPLHTKVCPICGALLDEFVKCPTCGASLPADFESCPICGEDLTKNTFIMCPKCETELDYGTEVCPICGADVTNCSAYTK